MKVTLDTDKLYYSIGEVSEMFKVSNSLIRYWESEFRQLKPQKNRRGDRKYISKDIKTLEAIYNAVKVKGYTIEGAKKALNEELQYQKKTDQAIEKLTKVRNGLDKLKKKIE